MDVEIKNIFDINTDDSEYVLLCMKIADNIHDFCKGRSDLQFKKMENLFGLNEYIIKSSPSTIEEATSVQLSINTGLYRKLNGQGEPVPKGKHSPINYTSNIVMKNINSLLHNQDKKVDIFINEDTETLLTEYITFITDIKDVSLSVLLERNIDGKKIFTDKLRKLCKGLLQYLFVEGVNPEFYFMLDAANISFKKLFYKSTILVVEKFVHYVDETNKWDMASNMMPELALVDQKERSIKDKRINDVIMTNTTAANSIIKDDPNYEMCIDNLEFVKVELLNDKKWISIPFSNLIDTSDNYSYIILNEIDYRIRNLVNIDAIKYNLEYPDLPPIVMRYIPVLSTDIQCFPVGLFGAVNNRYYGAIAFKNIHNTNLVIIVSRAYRNKDKDGEDLGVRLLSDIITNALQNSFDVNFIKILNALYETPERVKVTDKIKQKRMIFFALDIKRIGDWGQITQCYNNNKFINSLSVAQRQSFPNYKPLLFISLDNLAILYAQLLKVNYIHTKKKNDTVTFIMHSNNNKLEKPPADKLKMLIEISERLDMKFMINFNPGFLQRCYEMLMAFKLNICDKIINNEEIFNSYNLNTDTLKVIYISFPNIVKYVAHLIYSTIIFLVHEHFYAVYKYRNEMEQNERIPKKEDIAELSPDTIDQLILFVSTLINNKESLLTDIFNKSEKIKYKKVDLEIFISQLSEVSKGKKEPLLDKLKTVFKKSNVMRDNFDFSKSFIDIIDIIQELAKYRTPSTRPKFEEYKKKLIKLSRIIGNIYKHIDIIKTVHDDISSETDLHQIATLPLHTKFPQEASTVVGPIASSASELKSFSSASEPKEALLGSKPGAASELDGVPEINYLDINLGKFVSNNLSIEDFKYIHDENNPNVYIDKLVTHIMNILNINRYATLSNFSVNSDTYSFDALYTPEDIASILRPNIFYQTFNDNFKSNFKPIMVGGHPDYKIVISSELAAQSDLEAAPESTEDYARVKNEKIQSVIHNFVSHICDDDTKIEKLDNITVPNMKDLYSKSYQLGTIVINRSGSQRLVYTCYEKTQLHISYTQMVKNFYFDVFLPKFLSFQKYIFEKYISQIEILEKDTLISVSAMRRFIDLSHEQFQELHKTAFTMVETVSQNIRDIMDDDNDFDDVDEICAFFLKIYDLPLLHFISLFSTATSYVKESRNASPDRLLAYTEYNKICLNLKADDRYDPHTYDFAQQWETHLIIFKKMLQIVLKNDLEKDYRDGVQPEFNDIIKHQISEVYYDKLISIDTVPLITKNLVDNIDTWIDLIIDNISNIYKIDYGIVLPDILLPKQHVDIDSACNYSIQHRDFIKNLTIHINNQYISNYVKFNSNKLNQIGASNHVDNIPIDYGVCIDLITLFLQSCQNHENKPNIIFDEIVSLSNVYRLQEKTRLEQEIAAELQREREKAASARGGACFNKQTNRGLHKSKAYLSRKKKCNKNRRNSKKRGQHKSYRGGLIDDKKKLGFISHENFRQIYTSLKYLYYNFSHVEYNNFKALCKYFDIIIPDDIELDIKQIINYINSHFIQRYFIYRQNIVYNSIFQNIDSCNFDRFFEYLSLYLEIKKYADMLVTIERNISLLEDIHDIEFEENIKQLHITAESLDYYIERPIYSLYGEKSLLTCIDTTNLQAIVNKYVSVEENTSKYNLEDISSYYGKKDTEGNYDTTPHKYNLEVMNNDEMKEKDIGDIINNRGYEQMDKDTLRVFINKVVHLKNQNKKKTI
jgi:hypothetical protein